MKEDAKTDAPFTSDFHGRLIVLFLVAIGALMLGRAVQPTWYRITHFLATHAPQAYLILGAWFLATVAFVTAKVRNLYLASAEIQSITAPDEGSVRLGRDIDTGKVVHLKSSFRTMHTQLIGTTNAGKTASIVLPWVVRDMELGRGCIIVDGKSERGFLDTLHSYAVRTGREKDLSVFSLCSPHLSATFNPFCQGTPEQITERVFSAFNFTNEHYKNVQFGALRSVVALLMRRGQTPIPGVIRELLRDKATLQGWLVGLNDPNLSNDILKLTRLDEKEFAKNLSGLVTALGHFSQGDTMALYNTRTPEIDLKQLMKGRKICYFQLPTMGFPFLGEATGKLVLQCLQGAISELQVSGDRNSSLFSVYLDDFNDYIYPGFVTLLNKARSANIGVLFSHQSLGDLEKVAPDFKQTVLTNTNIKIIMRSNDPESAEHFAKVIGTRSSEKTTERRTPGFFGQKDTGEQSVRAVEEYIIHPNVFKSELGLGEGVVIIPHNKGRIVKQVQFRPLPDLPALTIPMRDLPVVNLVAEATCPETPRDEYKALDRTQLVAALEGTAPPAAA